MVCTVLCLCVDQHHSHTCIHSKYMTPFKVSVAWASNCCSQDSTENHWDASQPICFFNSFTRSQTFQTHSNTFLNSCVASCKSSRTAQPKNHRNSFYYYCVSQTFPQIKMSSFLCDPMAHPLLTFPQASPSQSAVATQPSSKNDLKTYSTV